MFREKLGHLNHHKVYYQERVLNHQDESVDILKVKPLFSTPLIHYLSLRKIPINVADSFCREVVHRLYGKDC